jgi:hypothetical protein
VKNGGAGYAEGDSIAVSTPAVAAEVTAVNNDGAITAVSFTAGTVYDSDPADESATVSGGSGEGAVCEVRTAYAPGDIQQDGELQYVPYNDPIVQMTRLRGFVREYLETSEVARRTVLSEALRRWSPAFLYVEGDITNFEGAWYTPNSEDIPIFGESPETNPEKWTKVGGGSDEDDTRISKALRRVDIMWDIIFGAASTFTSHFALDLYTLEGVNLKEGIWRDTLGRVEV